MQHLKFRYYIFHFNAIWNNKDMILQDINKQKQKLFVENVD